MIQQTHRTIHFTEYIPIRGREKDIDSPPLVHIDVKHNIIKFNARTLAILGMDGKFISFYMEPTKMIVGWSIREGLSEEMLKMKKFRLVKSHKDSGVWTTSINGIMKAFNGRVSKDNYKKLEVKKYIETEGVLEKGTVYYYVQLTQPYENIKETGD